ncbi:ABC transporter permease [Paenibacillus thalictri]|uniref:ABC transporter permease n=1 Tax=Paenibacillus thalictri TaxID=2527873 RepID=A0A4Q9DUD7_9BACL|nr:ABC transporter permease [Paenibacillus thalictri]TBL79966.1 hypothetical protein EYB31_10300 [Paenibacillus thalictri]
MRTFANVVRSEWLKMRKSNIWLLVFVSPVLSALAGLGQTLNETHAWEQLLASMAVLHAILFLPLLTGVFAAFVCRYEHAGGGWKQLLSLPMSRTTLYAAKFAVVVAILALTQLLFLAFLLAVGYARGIHEAVPWVVLWKSVLGGWIASLPLAALQLFVSVAWASFAAPLALNVVLTVPNMLIVNSSDYGPYYPWAQPVLSMIPAASKNFGAFNVSFETLLFIITGSFVLFAAAGLTYFQRKEI